jgi:hypothetical protein
VPIASRSAELHFTMADGSCYKTGIESTVPPAELESLMLQHSDIADVAVIGIYCEEEATELPRFVPAAQGVHAIKFELCFLQGIHCTR